MNPLLQNNMCIFAGKFSEKDTGFRANGKYYLIKFVKRSDGRGGFCKEAADFIESLGIPTEPHWNDNPRKEGWKASKFIEVQTSDTPMHHRVNASMATIASKKFQNGDLLHLLKKPTPSF